MQPPSQKLTVAVVGCAHGALDLIYSTIRVAEKSQKIVIDLLICCGDFEAARNDDDLATVEGPVKFRGHKDFYKYYNGEKIAPVLTLFCGGNHEAVNYLDELYYGGWAAPNIYFLGASGVVSFGGLRIAGFSGIFNAEDFKKGRFESSYEGNNKISAFHVREYDLWKLLHLPPNTVDCFISHDWPNCVIPCGDSSSLYSQRPSFEGQVIGSQAYTVLMNRLSPKWWFSGHMHVKFEADVPLADPKGNLTGNSTKFLALDKAMPERPFIQFIDFDPVKVEPKALHYDPEWIAIQRLTYQYFSKENQEIKLPKIISNTITTQETHWVNTNIFPDGNLVIPQNFKKTALGHGIKQTKQQKSTQNIKLDQNVEYLKFIQVPQ